MLFIFETSKQCNYFPNDMPLVEWIELSGLTLRYSRNPYASFLAYKPQYVRPLGFLIFD